ncbi:hypothetical protein GCM10022420_044350 [Streptomyces iranensis]|uniref:Uncharacterized protein n=1 Tax=Streptomyces iranensis TaxID=576784 RepID=A0ABS4N5T5_9ACTN|nr:hypothetical protein [Streptomyces iranensis]
MSGTSRSDQNGTEAGDTAPEPERPKVKQIALIPASQAPLPERGRGGFGDEQRDHSHSLQAKIDRGEEIPTPGSRAGSEERDIHEEEWRAHDRSGPYGQRRRRRN